MQHPAIKKDVDAFGLTGPALLGYMVIAEAFRSKGVPCVITSIIDGKHSEKSLHNAGNAIDFRSWVFGVEEEKDLFAFYVNELFDDNPDFEFYYEPKLIDENGNVTRHEHFHFEYQRKTK